MVKIANILMATDFSAYSDEALSYAVDLAKKFESKIHLIHVFQNPFFSNVVQYDQVFEKIKAEASEGLVVLSRQVEDEGVQAQALFKEGFPYDQILQAVEEVQADLIVMGTHGHTGLAHVMIGSVAERVVRRAKCPVLTVKPTAYSA